MSKHAPACPAFRQPREECTCGARRSLVVSEGHIVAEPPNDEAYYRGQAHVLNRLAEWMFEERQKVEPTSERWRTLADVTSEMHRLQNAELHPPDTCEHLAPSGKGIDGFPRQQA